MEMVIQLDGLEDIFPEMVGGREENTDNKGNHRHRNRKDTRYKGYLEITY